MVLRETKVDTLDSCKFWLSERMASMFINSNQDTIYPNHAQQIILPEDLHGYTMIYPCVLTHEDIVDPPCYRSIQANYIADEPPRYHTVVSTKQVSAGYQQEKNSMQCLHFSKDFNSFFFKRFCLDNLTRPKFH